MPRMINNPGDSFTKCWTCGNATNLNACPWARDGTPVDGWEATPTVIGRGYTYESFYVAECPLFWRDAHKGGREWNVFGRKPKQPTLDNDDSVSLASAICVKAVEDWKALGNGAIEFNTVDGQKVTRKELLEFFFSRWFEMLLGSFSQRTPKQIRTYIGITEDMRPEEVTA